MSKQDNASPLRIVRLSVENFKRLRAVEITPDGNVVTISGRNGAGKSSVLDAIEVALGGTRSAPARPVRDGEGSARVVLEFDDIIVTRTFTAAGKTSLKVESHDGLKYPSPQSMLDRVLGKLSFDPLAFARMDPKKRLEMLRALAGVDLSDLDSERAKVFADRTVVGRDGKRLEAQLAGLPQVQGVPDEAVSVSDIVAELEAAQTTRDVREAREREADAAAQLVETRRATLAALETQVAEAAEALEMASSLSASKAAVLAEAPAAPDLAPIRARLSSVEETNAGVRANQRRAEVAADLDEARKVWKTKAARLKAIDEEKTAVIAAADLPVEGLSWDDDGVLFGGLPFDQASSAEQLRASIAIAISLNPALRVLLVRDGSLLDEDGLRLLSEMATEAGAQVWLERVSEGHGVGVVIEDGSIKQMAEAAE